MYNNQPVQYDDDIPEYPTFNETGKWKYQPIITDNNHYLLC